MNNKNKRLLILVVLSILAIGMLIGACFVPCACWKNILISLGTGILSSIIVTYVIEFYRCRERRDNITIYMRYFSIVYALSVWYLKNIEILERVTLKVNLNLLCVPMSDIVKPKNEPKMMFDIDKFKNKHKIRSKATLHWLCKFFEVSDKKMVKLIDDFASRKFNLSTRYEDMFLNYFKSYNNLKNHIADYKYMSKAQIEGHNKDLNDLFYKFLISVNALLKDLKVKNLNVKFTEDDFLSADNYINKWIKIDKNLGILLDINDFIEICK